jgi:hypothetical protein
MTCITRPDLVLDFYEHTFFSLSKDIKFFINFAGKVLILQKIGGFTVLIFRLAERYNFFLLIKIKNQIWK